MTGFELAVFLHEIALPKDFSIAIQTSQITRAEHGPGEFTIRDRGGRGHVMETIGVHFATSGFLVPDDFTFSAAESEDVQTFVRHLGGQINPVTNGDRGRNALAWDAGFPRDVFRFGPFRGQGFLRCYAEAIRATPAGPIGGTSGQGERTEYQE